MTQHLWRIVTWSQRLEEVAGAPLPAMTAPPSPFAVPRMQAAIAGSNTQPAAGVAAGSAGGATPVAEGNLQVSVWLMVLALRLLRSLRPLSPFAVPRIQAATAARHLSRPGYRGQDQQLPNALRHHQS